jgi:superfamily I DNA/RNA helicase
LRRYSAALLQTSGEARLHYQQRWRHILVDEFQDTSLSQYELIRTLALPQNKVFVVGDVDQAGGTQPSATCPRLIHMPVGPDGTWA